MTTKSKRRSLILPIVLVILSLGIIIGTSLAYFTDTRNTSNPVDFGKIEISVDESFSETIPLNDALPGDKITDKISFTKAIDSEPMYVRAKVSFTTSIDVAEVQELVNQLNTYDLEVVSLTGDYAWSQRYGEYFYLIQSTNNDLAYLVEDTSEIVLSNGFEIPRELKQSQGYGQYFAQVNLMLEVQAIQNTGTNDLYEVDAIFEDVFGGSLYDNILSINLEDSVMSVTPSTLSNVIIQNSELQNKYNYFYDEDLTEPVALTDNLLGGDVIYTQPVTEGLIYTPIESVSGAYGGPSNANSVTEYRVGDGTTTWGNAVPSNVTDTNIVIAINYFDGSVLHPVTEIGQHSFSHKWNITSIIIPDSVTSIGQNAFASCSSLTSVSLGNSVTSIGERSFDGCSRLTSIIISDSITSIGGYAFYNTSYINTFVDNTNTTFTSNEEITGLTINQKFRVGNETNGYVYYVTTSNDANTYICFGGSTSSNGIKASENVSGEISIVDGTKCFYPYAFAECSGLTGDLIIPDSVTSIGERSFYGCSGLTGGLSIGDNVTSIGNSAFRECSGLTGDIIIPDSVTSIGGYAFSDCYKLVQIRNLTIGRLTLNGLPNNIGQEILYDTTTEFTNTLSEDGKYQIFTIGDKKYLMGFTADVDRTTANDIPNYVTDIYKYAFYNCNNLTGDLIIPDSVTSIGDRSFYGCSGLTGDIIIPDSVTSIGERAFQDCNGLTSVTIGEGVISIGNAAFYYCREITEINFNAINCKDLTSSNNIFSGAGYNTNGINLNIGANVTKIPAYLFSRMSKITSVVFAEDSQCKSIVRSAFAHCSGLISVTIDSKLLRVEDNVFQSCSKLSQVYYLGNSTDWNTISVGVNNTSLTNANRYYITFDESNNIVVTDKNNATVTSGAETYEVSYDNTDPSKVVATITFYNNNDYVVVATKDLV